ncbi:MAG: Asp-tRNA(Asn)/Glu-tRNA(Gln) amidotransferase subunit GatB [Patescibacteria group bacterium]
MNLQPIIGLETNVQLKTKTKMFCSCSTSVDNALPNTNVCPICLGHPGSLPVPNEQAIRWAVLLGLALNGRIAEASKFDRKNYFYPDLPKGYQISQFDLPIMQEGSFGIDVPGEKDPVFISLERLHLEEDAAKNIHGDDGKTYVDFNRGGTPLCEIVTRPHFTSAIQAKTFMQELRLLVRSLNISDGDMEKGQLRCDVNISLREVDKNGDPLSQSLNPKTEIKNVNSFKHVERAIEYEIQRQTKLWEAGTPPKLTTTRGWNDAKQITEEQRVKEDSADYRYFPEPDIPPMNLKDMADEIRHQIPELPQARRLRLVDEYGFKADDARQLVESPALADFTEHALSELGAWLNAHPDIEPDEMPERRAKLMKLFTTWLLTKLMGLLANRKIDIQSMKINPENFAEFIMLLSENRLTAASGQKVLEKMLDDGSDPSHAMDDLDAKRIDDADAVKIIVETVIEQNPNEVERYKNGEKQLLKFLVGQVMRESKGKADPNTVARIITDILG